MIYLFSIDMKQNTFCMFDKINYNYNLTNLMNNLLLESLSMQSINPLVQNKNNKSLILEHAKYLRIKC